jgi:serine/threonine protein kinase
MIDCLEWQSRRSEDIDIGDSIASGGARPRVGDRMDIRYEAYCLADPRYYESPERARLDGDSDAYRVETVNGWRSGTEGMWSYHYPAEMELPEQGWKIHVSATLDTAASVLKTVSEYCVGRGVPFKFLSSPAVLLAQNAKYAPRWSSGKFLTVYPMEVDQLRRVLVDLDGELAGSPGPYVLSDLRWNRGPLYVRYGGFSERYVYTEDGTQAPAIEAPDGRLVPDLREARFIVPEWVSVPSFLTAAASSRTGAAQPDEFPYDVIEALHFSNGGGVYRARRRTDGADVVLKEARPHAGLDADGRDAVVRLRREHATLTDLAGAAGIPRVHAYLTLGEHEFMVMDHMPGVSLHSWLAVNYPYSRTRGSDDKVAAYVRSAYRIIDQLRAIITALHTQGYVVRDLHPENVLVADDLRVSLIDFEISARIDDDEPRTLGAPGFAAPPSVQGVDADLYSLASIELHMFVPLNDLLWLCPEKCHEFLEHARSRFPLEPPVITRLARTLSITERGSLAAGGGDLAFTRAAGPWDRQMAALVAAITNSATPERTDRLFPGDITQFERGGAGFAFGAAGVLATLHSARYTVPDRYVDWLVDAGRAGHPSRVGLYDGAAGICHVLHRLGRREEAVDLFERTVAQLDPVSGVKLFDGLAGIGLVSLDFYRQTGEVLYLRRAEAAARSVVKAIEAGSFSAGAGVLSAAGSARSGNAVENFSGGLLYGWSGLALFLVRMYEVTGARGWVDAARAAVARDLDRCAWMPDGTLQVGNNERALPYLATGSAGVAVVCDMVLRHTPDRRLAQAVPALALACAADICVCAGLFNGRAGLVYTLRRLRQRLEWPDLDEYIESGIRALNLYAMRDEHGLVFPGEQNLRLSMDVATGSAGVLALLTEFTGATTEILPFLGLEQWGEVKP